jgi:hypothetical protein
VNATHPALRCWVCGDPATQVLEAVPAPGSDPGGPFRQYCCAARVCAALSRAFADSTDCRYVGARPLPVAICVGGLIEHWTADGPEWWACHGCPGCEGVA